MTFGIYNVFLVESRTSHYQSKFPSSETSILFTESKTPSNSVWQVKREYDNLFNIDSKNMNDTLCINTAKWKVIVCWWHHSNRRDCTETHVSVWKSLFVERSHRCVRDGTDTGHHQTTLFIFVFLLSHKECVRNFCPPMTMWKIII
jgi:hypothetical protein